VPDRLTVRAAVSLTVLLFAGCLGGNQASSFAERWEWAVSLGELSEEGYQVATSIGPAPEIHIARLGEEHPLLLPSEPEIGPLPADEFAAYISPVMYVGTIAATGTRVFLARGEPHVVAEACIHLAVGAGVGYESECWLYDPSQLGQWSGDGPPGAWLAVLPPPDTSLVTVELADGRTLVQRPIAGVAAFQLEQQGPLSANRIRAFDAGGRVLVDSVPRR
jgi:hypothetical protein